jgi:Holliday junction resolvase RusA-like endonuclease
MISFTVFGEPVAKGRPRFTRTGHCYTPAKTIGAESKIRGLAKVAKGSHTISDKPVAMRISFIFGMPKSWSIGKRELWEGLPCAKKPDLDNVVKTILDAINGAGIWADDSQVCEIYARKVWGATPRTEIQIITLEEQAGKTAKNKATGAAICSRGDKADFSFSTPPVTFFQPEKGNNEGE